MLKVQAFLSLEKSFAATMEAVWRPMASEVERKVLPLLDARKWDDAHDVVNRFTMNGVVTAHRKRLEELAVSSLLFGANNVTGSLRETSFVKGTQPIPYALQQALDHLTDTVEFHGAELVRNQLHELIRNEENVSVRKDDTSSEELEEPDKDDMSDDDIEEAGAALAEREGPRNKKRKPARREVDLADRLNAAVMGTGKMAIDIGANLTTSRLVTLGFLAEAINKRIDTYQINEVLDSRTCAVCQYMHGKTFYVEQEYSRVMMALGTMDTKELKSIAPWPDQSKAGLAKLNAMGLGELQTNGYGSPPFHPGCRGVLALSGTVTEEIPLGSLVVQD